MSINRSTDVCVVSAFLLLVALASGSQAEAAERIRWRTGAVDTAPMAPPEVREAITILASGPVSRHLVVQFNAPVDPRQRLALRMSGVRLLNYVGNNAYFASIVPTEVDAAGASRVTSLIGVYEIQRVWKLHPTLAVGKAPPWAVVDDGRRDLIVAGYVVFHRDVALAPDALEVVRRHGATVLSQLSSVNVLVVELPLANIPALADEDYVQWIEPPLPPLQQINDVTRQITEAEIVQAPPYDLDGSGVTVMVFDAGAALESHADFGGRLTARDSQNWSNHSTHVACTVGGDGAGSAGLYRGMAPGVTIESYKAACCPSGFLYTNPIDIETDYDEAINVHGAEIANNSIGTNVCSNGFDCEWTGDYGVTAQLIDSIVRGSLGQPFRIVWANGNERSCSRCRDQGVHTPEGYHSTAPPSCAKNHITVGALADNESVTSFTSWGPTDDGRLKPDISAPGSTVYSCSSSGGYTTMSGTSMAAPAVTGISALLLQDFREQFPLRNDPRNSTLKILLAHTAEDIQNAGPDYKTGFGSVRIQQAIDFMRSDNGLNFLEAEAYQATSYAVAVRVTPDHTQLKVTLAWDDFPAAPNAELALVNDLDLRVFAPDATQHLPWTLDPDNPGAPAVRTQLDRVNNIEQVTVDSPDVGLWLVEVFGFNVPEAPQPFSLCASPDLVYDCNENGVPDDKEIQADPDLDCSANGTIDECEPDCDGDGIADSCEVFEGTSTDCNSNGLPDDCEQYSDCNTNDVYDPCDIRDGPSLDCNENWIPDECTEEEKDCNANLVPDECDVDEGTSNDCNLNQVPDECEPETDCNYNGILDLCDIGGGTSLDCNNNSFPDECDLHGIIHVDDDGPNDPAPGDPTVSDLDEDGSPDHPYDSIQEAVNATGCGDVITNIVTLMDGIYTGVGNKDLDFGGRTVTVRSMNGPENCIIDCENAGRGFHFHNGEGLMARIEGLTIRNAWADFGGGIFCDRGSSPTIHNCVIMNNRALARGAGIYCAGGSNPNIDGCIIAGNLAGAGGISCYISDPSISNSKLLNNVADAGSGIHCINSSPSIVNCTFAGNSSVSGAGVYCSGGSRPDIVNSIFTGNTSSAYGGAIFGTLGPSMTVNNCTITGNAASKGGAVFLFQSGLAIRNSVLWADSAATGAEIMLKGPDASLFVAYSNIEGGEAGVGIEDGSTISWGAGNIEEDPLFVDADGADEVPGTEDDNFRLSPGSPCIDAGDNDAVAADVTGDFDGYPRFQDDPDTVDTGNGIPPIVDMGGHEFLADCNQTGIPDWCDVDCGTPGGACDVPGCGLSSDCTTNAIPDECEPDCQPNGVADSCDIDAATSQDCNEDGIPDECSLDTDGDDIIDGCDDDDDNDGVDDGVDTDPLDPDVCEDVDDDECDDCAVGTDDLGPLPDNDPANDGTDTDADGACDAGDTDDDNDGVDDAVDTDPLNPDVCEDVDADTCDDCAVGTDDFGPLSDADPTNDGPDADADGICDAGDNCALPNPDQADCQPNGIGDVCDVDSGTSRDCQSNGVPDECDISSGSSQDDNANGIPDACELLPPQLPGPPHDAAKHRYLSIDPTINPSLGTAIKVEVVEMRRCSGDVERACRVDGDCEAAVPGSGACSQHPDVGSLWWVQAPQQEPLGCLPGPCGDEDWFARVDAVPYFDTWTLSTLHIGDCEIIPVATYEMRACAPPDGVLCSDSLTIGTIEQPFVSPGFRGNYGDAVGPVDTITEEFTPPDGITNIVDVSAYILTKQNYGTPNKPQTHPTWVDLHGLGDGQPPQYILNISDLGQILKALAGDAWTDDPGNMNPGQCP